MSLRRLNNQQKKEFANLVKESTSPADLADHFHLSISTVHNYKKELKAEGVKIPDVRGQRPKGNIKGAGAINHSDHTHIIANQYMDGAAKDGIGKDGAGRDGIWKDGIGKDGIGKDGIGRDGIGKDGALKDGFGLRLTVNGIRIDIHGTPTFVNINNGHIEVDFRL